MPRHRPRPKTVLRCPRCLSYEITSLALVFSGSQYVCRKCGYEGALVLEEDAPEAPVEPDPE